MKKQNVQDERITTQRRKIKSEACGILMIALFASIVVQQYFLNAPFEQYAAEVICFFGITIYIIVRYMMLGLNIYGDSKHTKGNCLVSSIVTGAVITTINGVLNYLQYADKYKEDGMGFFVAVLLVTFISGMIGSFLVLSLLSYLNNKNQAKIQKQLDQAEQEE